MWECGGEVEVRIKIFPIQGTESWRSIGQKTTMNHHYCQHHYNHHPLTYQEPSNNCRIVLCVTTSDLKSIPRGKVQRTDYLDSLLSSRLHNNCLYSIHVQALLMTVQGSPGPGLFFTDIISDLNLLRQFIPEIRAAKPVLDEGWSPKSWESMVLKLKYGGWCGFPRTWVIVKQGYYLPSQCFLTWTWSVFWLCTFAYLLL